MNYEAYRLAVKDYLYIKGLIAGVGDGRNGNPYCNRNYPIMTTNRCLDDRPCRCDITDEIVTKYNYGYYVEIER